MISFLKTTAFLLLFVLNPGLFEKTVHAQNDPEQQAKNLVENGQYAEAIPYFEDLVHLYPQDKMLNYYLGICLVETEQLNQQAQTALETSLGEETPVMSLYYLAQCYHAKGNFSEAMNYYNQFDDNARRKEKKNTKLEELKALCEQEINPFSTPEEEDEAEQTEPTTPIEEVVELQPEEVEIPAGLEDSLIHFQVNSTIKYLKIDQFNSASSLQAFVRGWQAEQELHNLTEEANLLRAKYNSAFAGEKEEIANAILALEKESYTKSQLINQNYTQARLGEKDYWAQASPETRHAFSEKIQAMEDSIIQAKEAKRLEKLEAQKPLVLPDSLVQNLTPEEPAAVSTGVVYKIQIGAYSRTPPEWVQRLFKKLSVIRRIDQYTDENGVTVYTVGELKSYQDALQMQSQVRTEGVSDAFIAAYKDGERIPLKEARQITGE
ncbi:tetratricopeptide repeat protein [uncultured Sunxiuqinia sp.]|uniref:SPOR domain-containing protein n=1 Tax=uncultured Sunxiuqinia sp. TaxID=1573825 RepID=UPI00262787E3|nr:tetratricopeptide repeat protein [uncultured Sunxiuqinia sp.]